MKTALCTSVILVLFTLAVPSAHAVADLDLTALTSEGLINGALFQTADFRSSGTGVFQTFLKFGSNDKTVEAYNTDARPFEADYDMNNSRQHTRQLPLGVVPYMTPNSSLVTTGLYYEFLLDINQKGAEGKDGDPDWNLSLDELQIALGSTGDMSSYSTIFSSLIYDMDGAGDARVLLNGKLDTGSGQADLAVYIPKSLFDGQPGNCVYLYAKFGEPGNSPNYPNNDGFEEWAIESTYELPVIPAPPAVLLAGLGAGVIGWLRKRKTI
ncbi:MAG: hypothetical protein ACYS8Z_17925 [Planctomycetota bacterium]|jgi:hypothetical protein